jgi:hypothetical protein
VAVVLLVTVVAERRREQGDELDVVVHRDHFLVSCLAYFLSVTYHTQYV